MSRDTKHPIGAEPAAGRWVRDGWVAAADLLMTVCALTGALALHARGLAALAGLWAVLTLRQGWLAVRARRSR
ncbi:hypothetical protein G3I60_37190 [Streptomyces sp. SID13666]|uniref:hypothetical protein n=1 Tax=unclassified Streptomyces TaxID=2593676 RepID=UPI0013C1AE3C|nr:MULTISPECIES: hypothetical protein [unclassified Streptomyces]NEA59649.1 hypothetical protein [Streptomyces sp. SID13666]NEA75828.1 hypothetical protein [Streptomyces sp. SID13588]